jgi:hypothetical protein
VSYKNNETLVLEDGQRFRVRMEREWVTVGMDDETPEGYDGVLVVESFPVDGYALRA